MHKFIEVLGGIGGWGMPLHLLPPGAEAIHVD